MLRYAGALEPALRDCDTALSLDSTDPFFRSCGITNSLAGRHDRALQFFELSPGTEYASDNLAVDLMRQGRFEEAKGLFRGTDPSSVAVIEVIKAGPGLARKKLQELVDLVLSTSDVELPYWSGSAIASVGEHEAGLTLVREGIERGYCSFPFMETDPLLAGLRADPALTPGWNEAIAAGKECHERFLAESGAA